MESVLLESLKYLIPALVVTLTTWLVLSNMLENKLKLKQMELQLKRTELASKQKQELLPIQLQAYERLTLFLERIMPQSLIARNRQEGMIAPELQMAMIATIRTEYEHNITQQIYVSSDAWMFIQGAVEETISIINRIASDMPTDATGTDLAVNLLNHFMGDGGANLPSERAIAQLKEEVVLLFGR